MSETHRIDYRIDTPVGKIPRGKLLVAQAVAKGQSIPEIAEELGLAPATIYGYQAYWRKRTGYQQKLGTTLEAEISEYVSRHRLSDIKIPPIAPVHKKPSFRKGLHGAP